jgi:hypothetical protein
VHDSSSSTARSSAAHVLQHVVLRCVILWCNMLLALQHVARTILRRVSATLQRGASIVAPRCNIFARWLQQQQRAVDAQLSAVLERLDRLELSWPQAADAARKLHARIYARIHTRVHTHTRTTQVQRARRARWRSARLINRCSPMAVRQR